MRWHIALAAAGALAAATAPAGAAESAGAFLGPWIISEAKPAPWVTPAGPANTALIDAKIAFHRTSIEAPAPLNCPEATFWSEPQPAANVFSGNLSEPDTQARAMGFGSRVVILSASCKVEGTPIPDFALVDRRTAMFALDGYIYVMKR
jgi:hypothetical protein